MVASEEKKGDDGDEAISSSGEAIEARPAAVAQQLVGDDTVAAAVGGAADASTAVGTESGASRTDPASSANSVISSISSEPSAVRETAATAGASASPSPTVAAAAAPAVSVPNGSAASTRQSPALARRAAAAESAPTRSADDTTVLVERTPLRLRRCRDSGEDDDDDAGRVGAGVARQRALFQRTKSAVMTSKERLEHALDEKERDVRLAAGTATATAAAVIRCRSVQAERYFLFPLCGRK